MALRRYIEDTWRRVSIRHGFAEVDGPTFEFLDLYKVKSGDAIVSELFHFESRADKHGNVDEFALRPEFTPTLARMVAAKANGLAKPIKWFSIPRCYRAERPQKGRLREFIQWNVDVLGDATPTADADCLAVCIDALREFGLTESDIRVGWNHRELMTKGLINAFLQPDHVEQAYTILDKLYKLGDADRHKLCDELGCTAAEKTGFDKLAAVREFDPSTTAAREAILESFGAEVAGPIRQFDQWMAQRGMGAFSNFDFGVVRGLAYYTGFVFEVFDRVGENRAVAGGGRYDKLIELLGGPAVPAIGFGMGDVVLEILLRERNKLPASLLPRPAVFVVNAVESPTEAQTLLAALRSSQWNDDRTAIVRPGLHAITSYKATKNVGKILQEAAGSGARFALIIAPSELERGAVKLKDMATREEREIALTGVVAEIHAALIPRVS